VIPGFTISGALPPYMGGDPTMRDAVSPYAATLTELCRRFATSSERIAILNGLLSYRRELKAAGFAGGFQWIDGSFIEDVEALRGRPPGDIDIVTFTHPPPELYTDTDRFLDEFSSLIDPNQCKLTFRCDAYIVDLTRQPLQLVSDTSYWFGLFSHQRDTALWKGIISIDFDADEDEASNLLGGEA